MIIAITIGVLTAGGVFMVLQRGMVRLVLGMTLLSHATNLFLLAAGIGAWRSEPLMGSTNPTDAADPLPQAFVLTAIVISMAATAFMLALAGIGTNDDTMSDPLKSAPDTTDGTLPEVQSGEIAALQTMGRSATQISPDSAQAQRRLARVGAQAGHTSGQGSEHTSSKDGAPASGRAHTPHGHAGVSVDGTTAGGTLVTSENATSTESDTTATGTVHHLNDTASNAEGGHA